MLLFFSRTFNFENMRIDEALRIYLSEFRLPGEAPLISALLEHFAARWRVSNSINMILCFCFNTYFLGM